MILVRSFTAPSLPSSTDRVHVSICTVRCAAEPCATALNILAQLSTPVCFPRRRFRIAVRIPGVCDAAHDASARRFMTTSKNSTAPRAYDLLGHRGDGVDVVDVERRARLRHDPRADELAVFRRENLGLEVVEQLARVHQIVPRVDPDALRVLGASRRAQRRGRREHRRVKRGAQKQPFLRLVLRSVHVALGRRVVIPRDDVGGGGGAPAGPGRGRERARRGTEVAEPVDVDVDAIDEIRHPGGD
eukprot:28676-Pelagococcus_subviridis.AAC.2